MAAVTYCQTCGGVVGATQTTDHGKPCRCQDHAKVGDTVDDAELQVESGSSDNTKVCVSCGKDLRGHRRYKDSVGYWCKDCHKADRKSQTPEQRCPDCGRMKPVDKLIEFEGEQICTSCAKIRRDEAELKQKRLEAKAESDRLQQAKMIRWVLMGVGATILLIIAIIAQMT